MKNVDLIAQQLGQAGVRWVFGVPSGPVLPLLDALRRSSVEFVLTASETSAAFMATAVGYLTGVPGVCVSTLGPGATNLATGVGAAWLDRVPLLALTCDVPSAWLEQRVQMRIDHHRLFDPLTKASVSLRDGRVGEHLGRALMLAAAEPPESGAFGFAEDIASQDAAATACLESPPAPKTLDGNFAAHMAGILRQARRPLLACGLGVTRSGAVARLLQFAERQNIPFVTTLHAKGFLPESHPNWCGVLGRARRSKVKGFTDRADLILGVGYDPIEINYEEWTGGTAVAHVAGETADTDGAVRFVWNAAADLDAAIHALADLPVASNDWSGDEWSAQRVRFDQALRPATDGFPAYELLDLLRDAMPSNGILAYDVGAHTHQIASQWRTDEPRTLLATNGWSSMGFGMPAAFAAKLLYPHRTVVCVVGDGGFQMTVGELAMARRLALAVPVIVLNDGWLGLMKVKQERKNYPLYGVRLGDPPESPAHYFGVPCRAVKTASQFREALAWSLAQSGPVVIEAFIDAGAYSQTVFD